MNVVATAATPSLMPPSTKTLRVVVKGRVQGVFFRDWTVQTARELGLKGWVRNRRDGSVEALFSGDPAAVDEMVERRCRVGPPAAMVTALSSFPSEDDPGQGFQRKPTQAYKEPGLLQGLSSSGVGTMELIIIVILAKS
ncbi:hypothetical protein OPV22_024235 [Ensete ventricosum]|uniref:Acylphosphatase n=1 Tax=Ensete ventricosum TaxID=4639 RepID=A0AAV8QYQ5_ENSVE|nr:hypothetical protein OPV22_024235 [Ensete ventricosum]